MDKSKSDGDIGQANSGALAEFKQGNPRVDPLLRFEAGASISDAPDLPYATEHALIDLRAELEQAHFDLTDKIFEIIRTTGETKDVNEMWAAFKAHNQKTRQNASRLPQVAR